MCWCGADRVINCDRERRSGGEGVSAEIPGRRAGVAPLTHRRRARVRADGFSTRWVISSNRPNDCPGMGGLGRLAMDGVVQPE
jgi:hypothetical protein